MSLTDEMLKQLWAPFPRELIHVKVQSIDRENGRACLVKYLYHADVADRLDEVDPTWSSKIYRAEVVPAGNENEKEFAFVSMELTIANVVRSNVGEGKDPKSAASDALKRCAMLFGVGRSLYDKKGKAWVDYDADRDRHRKWTLEDYENAISGRAASSARAPKASGRKPPVTANKTPEVGRSDLVFKSPRTLIAEVRRFQRLLHLSEIDLRSWAIDAVGVSADKMDVSQLQQFVGVLQIEIRKAGIPV